MLKDTPTMQMAIKAKFFYFLPEVKPSMGDYVVVAEFGKSMLPVLSTMEFYEINHVDGKFDETGTIVFYKTASELDPIESKIKSFYIYKTASGQTRYIPAQE
jgi:hypothetical protein